MRSYLLDPFNSPTLYVVQGGDSDGRGGERPVVLNVQTFLRSGPPTRGRRRPSDIIFDLTCN